MAGVAGVPDRTSPRTVTPPRSGGRSSTRGAGARIGASGLTAGGRTETAATPAVATIAAIAATIRATAAPVRIFTCGSPGRVAHQP